MVSAQSSPQWPPLPPREAVDPERLREAEAFWQIVTPHRHGWYESVVTRRGEADPIVQGIRSRFVARFERLRRLQAEDEPLYAALLDQHRAADETSDALREIAASDLTDDGRETLRRLVRRQIDALIAARAARLERLREDLRREDEALQADRDRIDVLVEERVGRLLNTPHVPEAGQ